VVQGLRGAFSGLERDLLLARDAIVAVPGEVVESGSAKAAAKAVWKRAPTVILRPAIGVSKAVGQTLLGAGNTLDPSNRRKMEDVSDFTIFLTVLVRYPDWSRLPEMRVGTGRGLFLMGRVWLTILFYRSINVTEYR
jgi:hypothetical protein